jgi:energy-coupling factor transporter transmembrane protein EcfT
MRKLIKFLLVAALILFIGVPLSIVALVFLLGALGVVVGIGGAIIGLVLTVLKFALMIVLPVLLLWWIASRMLSRERTL